MTTADAERLGIEYSASEPKAGRLARALHVDVPVWRELGRNSRDLDERVFGVGWWAPHPGTSRRILISDHLFTCVRCVEANLIEARLHLIEAMDFWARESDFHARAVSLRFGSAAQVALQTASVPWTRSLP